MLPHCPIRRDEGPIACIVFRVTRTDVTGDVTLLQKEVVTSNMTVTSVFSRSCDANSSANQHFTPKQMENDPDPAKLVFLGDPAVGKTSFLLRFNNGELTEREDNLVVFDFAKRVAVDGTSYHVNFWDMSGALEDRLRPLAYPGTSVFMLCFDIANRDSFENIKESWITEIRHYMPNTPFLLIGNKMDLRDAK